MSRLKSRRPDDPRDLSLFPPIPASELAPTHTGFPADVQQPVPIKEEAPSSPSVDQQDSDFLYMKEEQEDLWTSQEGERLNGLEEADVTGFPFTVISVKIEDDDEKPEFSQLRRSPAEDNGDRERPTSGSEKEIKAEADEEDCRGPEAAKNSDLHLHLQPNAEGKSSGCFENKVSTDDDDGDDDDWQEPLSASGPESGDSDVDWKESTAHESSVNTDAVGNPAKKSFSCSGCGQRFQNKQSLQRHRTGHSGKMSSSRLANPECFRVKQVKHVDSPIKLHGEEKPFGCDVCGQRFNHKANLKTHTRVHTGEKPFTCSMCEKRFRQQYSLDRHMRIHTGEKPFSCAVCGKRFLQLGDLKRHRSVHTGEKPFNCGICGKRFTQRIHFKTHMTVHTGEKPFGCDVCGKTFNREGNLKVHKRVHTREQPFSCEFCGKKFSQPGVLKKHRSVHTGLNPFVCDVCGKRFNYNKNLKRHVRIHTGEKPFGCEVCNKRFLQLGDLKRHTRVHAGD